MTWIVDVRGGMRFLAVLVSCALIFSFGLHTVDTHHTHFGQDAAEHHEGGMGTVLSEYAHAGDKKFLVALLALYAFMGAVAFSVTSFPCFITEEEWRRQSVRALRVACVPFVVTLFSDGILHPKLCG